MHAFARRLAEHLRREITLGIDDDVIGSRRLCRFRLGRTGDSTDVRRIDARLAALYRAAQGAKRWLRPPTGSALESALCATLRAMYVGDHA